MQWTVCSIYNCLAQSDIATPQLIAATAQAALTAYVILTYVLQGSLVCTSITNVAACWASLCLCVSSMPFFHQRHDSCGEVQPNACSRNTCCSALALAHTCRLARQYPHKFCNSIKRLHIAWKPECLQLQHGCVDQENILCLV